MSRNDRRQGQSGNGRQNEYFVPRDGIDREVITADICRYLGNDALVRPGNYQDEAGRSHQGYFITAYRNLTTAMIADLKGDSARWEQERRRHQAGTVRYQDSATYRGSQVNSGQSYSQGEVPGYPQNESSAYATTRPGASTGFASSAYPSQSGYTYPSNPTGGYPTQATDLRFTTNPQGSAMPNYSSQPVAWTPGANLNLQPQDSYDTPMSDPMPPSRGGASTYSRGTMQPQYTTSGTTAYGYQTPSSATTFAQPQDSLYGRGGYPSATSTAAFSDSVASPAGKAYSPVDPAYDDQMTGQIAGTGRPIGSAVPQTTGSSGRREREHGRERSDRERDRDRADRDRDRPDRDRHPDRDDKASRKGHSYHYGR